MPLHPQSILVCRLDHIGDVLLSTPILHSLKDKYPEVKIYFLCGSWAKQVVENNPYIEETIVIDCPWWASIRGYRVSYLRFAKQYFKVLEELRKAQIQIFIELRGDVRHIFLFGWLSRIPIRISNIRSGGKWLLTNWYEYQEGRHEILRNYDLLQQFEPIKRFHKPEMFSHTPREVTRIFERANCKANVRPNGYVVLYNGGRSPLRRINSQRLSVLCSHLINSWHLSCILVGAREEFHDGEALKSFISSTKDSFYNLCGVLSLGEIAEVINHALLFVGTDSALLHLASSTGTPIMSLFGPMDPVEVSPFGEKNRVIYHRYECSPCLQEKCIVTGSPNVAKCMDDITGEELIAMADRMLLKTNDTN